MKSRVSFMSRQDVDGRVAANVRIARVGVILHRVAVRGYRQRIVNSVFPVVIHVAATVWLTAIVRVPIAVFGSPRSHFNELRSARPASVGKVVPSVNGRDMLSISMRKSLLLGALCASTFGFVYPAVCAQEVLPVGVAAASGERLLRDAHALLEPTSQTASLEGLTPPQKLARQIELVERNAPALVVARQALSQGIALPKSQTAEAIGGNTDILGLSREIARQFRQESDVRAAQGDGVAASQSSLDALELGAQISRGSLIHALSGYAIAAIARRSLEDHAALLNAAQSREVADKWEQTSAGYNDFAGIWRYSADESAVLLRANMKDFDDPKKRAQIQTALDASVKSGEMTAQEAMDTRDLMKFSLDDLEADLRATFDKVGARGAMPYAEMLQSEPVRGASANTTFIVESISPTRTRFSVESNIVNNRLLVAALRLRAMKLEGGDYPATFDAGADPFSPTLAPLVYKRAGDSYVLYSVGPDGKDDDGGKIQTSVTDARTGAKSVNDRLAPNSMGDIVAPVL